MKTVEVLCRIWSLIKAIACRLFSSTPELNLNEKYKSASYEYVIKPVQNPFWSCLSD